MYNSPKIVYVIYNPEDRTYYRDTLNGYEFNEFCECSFLNLNEAEVIRNKLANMTLQILRIEVTKWQAR